MRKIPMSVMRPVFVTMFTAGLLSAQNTEQRAVEFVRSLDVVRLDSTQSHMQFGDWLLHYAGPKASLTWEVNDCGAQTGNPADSSVEIPMCIEADVKLTDGRTVRVMVSAGTFKAGISATPGVAGIWIEQNGTYTDIRTLGVLADVLTDNIYTKIETGLRKSLADLGSDLVIEHPRQRYGIAVRYRTRKYMLHSTNKTGKVSAEAHETVGPDYDGFLLALSLQESNTPAQAMRPQILHEAYWDTELNATPVGNGEREIVWNLSYGVRTDRPTLQKIRNVIIESAK